MHKAPSTSLGMRSAGSAFRRAARMPRNRLNFGSGLRRPLGRPNFVGSHSLANESASSGDPVGLCPTGQPRAAVPTCFVALYAALRLDGASNRREQCFGTLRLRSGQAPEAVPFPKNALVGGPSYREAKGGF